jgi:hypothetical protein
MINESLFFSDNFFSAGRTEIYNDGKEKIGELDLKSAFSSSIDVLDEDGRKVVCGKFSLFGGKWIVFDDSEKECGELRAKFSFFSKKYEYTAHERGIYSIQAEPFSHLYEIYDDQANLVAKFEKISGFFSSPAYQLSTFSEPLKSVELIAIVMGVNFIQKRRRNAANNGAV